MSSAAIPASLGTAEPVTAQDASVVDASLIALPETRLPADVEQLHPMAELLGD